MPATQVRPLIFGDPANVWLEHHGVSHGLEPDHSPYDFLEFIATKSRQFQAKWIERLAPETIPVCTQAYEVRSSDKIRRTVELMQMGVPVISQAALWWAPERIYGTADILIHTSWIAEHFPNLISDDEVDADARYLRNGKRGHYVVMDVKFTTKLTEPDKATDLANDSAQVRLYSFMLGNLQGYMPRSAFLITRDRLLQPLPVAVSSACDAPLDRDLAALRDTYLDIKLNGAGFLPWTHAMTKSDFRHDDERWSTAKKIIAFDKVPGRDPAILLRVTESVKVQLAEMGFKTLNSMLSDDPRKVPLEKCKGIGKAIATQQRAILQANRSGCPVPPQRAAVPQKKEHEFFVDFEYLTNLNVDFDRDWPALKGREMIFMIGVGSLLDGQWSFRAFTAAAETAEEEWLMFERFLGFLQERTDGRLTDKAASALYHWSSAEVWQSTRAADRQNLPAIHPLRNLPWLDLQKPFLNGPCALPGAWDFGLKPVAKALGGLDADLDPRWPVGIDEGLRAMVMGWKAYEKPAPLETAEMATICDYLEADCRALWSALRFLRRYQ